MMKRAVHQALLQVSQILEAFDPLPSAQADALYTDSMTGRHLRHVFDHFHALRAGLATGCIDYNVRHRDSVEEICRHAAIEKLEDLELWLMSAELNNREMTILSEVDCTQASTMRFDTNLDRELLYVLNHTIHHAAHIRLALQHRGLTLPTHIGIAPCTASFQRQNASVEAPCAP